jgi:ABC-type taurine transport system ATPase subunit
MASRRPSKTFDGRHSAAQSLGLKCHQGERLALPGPSGCVKSSTLKAGGHDAVGSGRAPAQFWPLLEGQGAEVVGAVVAMRPGKAWRQALGAARAALFLPP